MTTEATIGWGLKAFLGTSALTSSLQELAEVTDAPFPEDQVADVEATNYQSAGRRKEYIAGLIDGGTGDLVMNYVPGSATDQLCRDALAAGDVRAFRLQILQADSTYWQVDVDVIVKGYKRTAPIDNVQKATMTVRFTGAATETDI